MRHSIIKNKVFSIALYISISINFIGFNTLHYMHAKETLVSTGQSNIINGSFEEPDLKSLDENDKAWTNTTKDEIPGWETTSTDAKIEIGWINSAGESPHMKETRVTESLGVVISDGDQFAELIGNESSSLFQVISLNADSSYNWTVHHRGRDGVDTIALMIFEDTNINYAKASKTDNDHFSQIVSWIKEEGIVAPEAGNMSKYVVYTTNLLESCSFEESTTGSYFSFTQDDEHTVKFEIYLISTDKAGWGEYTGSYYSDADKNILFAMTSFHSASTKSPSTSGNLIDNFSFLDTDNNNLLINAGFEDVVITSSYKNLKAKNAPSPTAGVGWSTTASDYCVEIGNITKGNPYNIPASSSVTIFNKAWIRDGQQFAELNANQESSLYQIVNTDIGKMYKWGLSHRGRDGVDKMALIIGPNQPYAPKKTSISSRDQLMQIVDWLYAQTERALDIPDQGCSDVITLYTPKFNSNGGYSLADNIFSWQRDDLHTEEWSVWIISSNNDTWHDYGEFDENADYKFDYVVPEGQTTSIFGFVSCDSTKSNGSKDITYGNLIDNIVFKEYYYTKINNAINNYGGTIYITNEDNTFIFESPDSGWALLGSDIVIHVKEGDRGFLGGYIDGVFIAKDAWEYDEVSGEYTYTLTNIDGHRDIDIRYIAKTVVYDSRNNYEYQYNGDGTGYEIPLGPELPEYISHEPEADDGWMFDGWQYVSTLDSTIYSFDAIHKVVFNENTTDIGQSTFEIHRILPDNSTEVVVSDIPYDEGITFVANWKYRQRVISKTFYNSSSSYNISSEGGYAEINIMSGEEAEKFDYLYNSEIVGKELYCSSNNVYIQLLAHSKVGYTFNGWYDASGKQISTSTSYTYKVQDGAPTEIYAYFEPIGYNIIVNNSVIGNFGDTTKYFTVNITLSGLRENKVYMITGLTTNPINVDGATVTNQNKIKADDNGEATITLYMKHGDSATFIYLPEHCIYSVDVDNSKNYGYTTYGELFSQELLEETTVDLVNSNEVSPPTGVFIKTKHWNYMLGIGALLLIGVRKIKRKEDIMDE